MIRLILSVVVGFVVLSLAGAEVKSFLGVDFGTKVDGSRFTGPIENGSYTFKGPILTFSIARRRRLKAKGLIR